MDRESTRAGGRIAAAVSAKLLDAAHSPARGTRLSVVIGRWLALTFAVCLVTGFYSHLLQDPSTWPGVTFSRPAWLYAVTQSVHIVAGTVSIPLLLGKLWAVYPELLRWPPVTSVLHGLERVSIAVLVSASLVEVTIGVINTFQWYPWPFPFRETHFALAWVILGSLLIHVAVKYPKIAAHWRGSRAASAPDAGRARRRVLALVGAAAAAAFVGTASENVPAVRALAVFTPRRPGRGSQGLAVNRTAEAAGVAVPADAADWRLRVVVGERVSEFSLAELAARPQAERSLPIACVEGWVQDAAWGGVPLAGLLEAAGASAGDVVVESLERAGNYRMTILPERFAWDPLTLVALRLGGEPLSLDHGFPARLIAPGRPGVLQTKWLAELRVITGGKA
ncbi:molybdopterin-dependent oxidoreductase [Sinomonas albida]|uniref:molybdopterin-dependent oxidoreductase n=1 Tax=Sinomonas albida TaxID=369942 RepID=UPI0010A85D85|nr:molybdopterin-dependent oxidoreductase [Sinomonas albida]